MIYLIFSIICSVTVGVLLKFAKRYQISIAQAITWNYFFAFCLSAYFFRPETAYLTFNSIGSAHLALGFLLPTIFVFLALSVEKTGLARTDIAQRLSLFISLTAAYFLFNDTFSPLKYVGVAIGFVAIILTLYRPVKQQINAVNWIYPFVVFLGFGIIDICFKRISQQAAMPYTTALSIIFGIAFCFSLVYLTFLLIKRRTHLQFINMICGAILSFFNFGNIFFYLKAHQALSNNPSTVFAAMNIGVILCGSLIGVLLFKEKLSLLNYAGLVFALVAIILITLTQWHAF